MPRKQTSQWSATGETDEEFGPSRSQRKRDSTALQELGERLTQLPPAALDGLPLTPDLRAAVAEWRRIASREGRRRQLQFVGRLMREEADAPALRAALDALSERHAVAAFLFRHVEAWRDELLAAAPEARPALCAGYGLPADRVAEVLELAARAVNERDNHRPPHAFRALFRLLRELAPETQASL